VAIEQIAYDLENDASACQFLFGKVEPPRFPRRKFGSILTENLIIEFRKQWIEYLEAALNQAVGLLQEQIEFTFNDPNATQKEIKTLTARLKELEGLRSFFGAVRLAFNGRYIEIRSEQLIPLLRIIGSGLGAIMGALQHGERNEALIAGSFLDVIESIARGVKQCGLPVNSVSLTKVFMARGKDVQPVLDRGY